MPALKFENNTGQSKFTGIINHGGFEYNYVIYLTPLTNPNEKNEIVSYFGNRTYKGKLCLDIHETDISNMIDVDDLSALLIVSVNGINNVASGSLQIFDWCNTRKGYDVWINDVCKISPDDVILQEKTIPGSTGVPVDIMFILMEQLVAQNLHKTNIKLFVEDEPSNAGFLVPRYKKIGFEIDKVCSRKNPGSIVMEKKRLQPNLNFIDFSFLNSTQQKQIIGGRYIKRKTNKRKIVKKKTYKRKYKK